MQRNRTLKNGADLSEENLVLEWPIDIGGVEEGDATIDGVVDEGDHVGLGLRGPVEGRHAHTSEPLNRDLEALGAQLDLLNCCHIPSFVLPYYVLG